MTGTTESQKIGQLSKGYRQRVGQCALPQSRCFNSRRAYDWFRSESINRNT
jgi:hypothetical protein